MKSLDKSKLMFSNKFLASLIIPLVIEVLLTVSVGMADTMMVAQAGESAVSGVSLVNNIQNLLAFLLSAFGTGGAVVASQLIGKGDKDKACYSAKQLMNISILFSLALMAVMLLLEKFIITAIYKNLETAVLDAALLYYTPILISMPFLSIQTSASALCRSMGKSKITMKVSVAVNIVNVLGNAICIFVFNLGALGVGIASLLSRIVGAAIMYSVLLNKNNLLHIINPLRPEIDFKMISTILRIALPSGVENSIFHIGKIMVSSTIAALGTGAIAADAILNNIGTLNNIPGSAIGMASITIIGQCVGAKEFDQVKYYAKKLMAITYASMATLSVILYIATPFLVSAYNMSPETEALATKVVIICLIQNAFFWPMSFAFPNILRATGDVKYTMVVSIFSMWIFRVMLSQLFALKLGMGLEGVYWGMYIDWYFRIILFLIRFKSGRWKTKAIV